VEDDDTQGDHSKDDGRDYYSIEDDDEEEEEDIEASGSGNRHSYLDLTHDDVEDVDNYSDDVRTYCVHSIAKANSSQVNMLSSNGLPLLTGR